MTTLHQVSEILTRGADSQIRHIRAAVNADPMDQKDPYAYVAQLKKTRLSGFVRLYRTRAARAMGAMIGGLILTAFCCLRLRCN